MIFIINDVVSVSIFMGTKNKGVIVGISKYQEHESHPYLVRLNVTSNPFYFTRGDPRVFFSDDNNCVWSREEFIELVSRPEPIRLVPKRIDEMTFIDYQRAIKRLTR